MRYEPCNTSHAPMSGSAIVRFSGREARVYGVGERFRAYADVRGD